MTFPKHPATYHFCSIFVNQKWIRTDMPAQLQANTIKIHNHFNDLNQELYDNSNLFLRFSLVQFMTVTLMNYHHFHQWEQISVHDLRTYMDISKRNCCLHSFPTATTSSLKHFDTCLCKSSRITFCKYSSMKNRVLK